MWNEESFSGGFGRADDNSRERFGADAATRRASGAASASAASTKTFMLTRYETSRLARVCSVDRRRVTEAHGSFEGPRTLASELAVVV